MSWPLEPPFRASSTFDATLDGRSNTAPLSPAFDHLLGQALAILDSAQRCDRPVEIVISGPPRSGRTKLAVYVCDTAEQQGWTTGFLAAGVSSPLIVISAVACLTGDVVVVVDDCDDRPELVECLRGALQRDGRSCLVSVTRPSAFVSETALRVPGFDQVMLGGHSWDPDRHRSFAVAQEQKLISIVLTVMPTRLERWQAQYLLAMYALDPQSTPEASAARLSPGLVRDLDVHAAADILIRVFGGYPVGPQGAQCALIVNCLLLEGSVVCV
jgi:hypothetical protein